MEHQMRHQARSLCTKGTCRKQSAEDRWVQQAAPLRRFAFSPSEVLLCCFPSVVERPCLTKRILEQMGRISRDNDELLHPKSNVAFKVQFPNFKTFIGHLHWWTPTKENHILVWNHLRQHMSEIWRITAALQYFHTSSPSPEPKLSSSGFLFFADRNILLTHIYKHTLTAFTATSYST